MLPESRAIQILRITVLLTMMPLCLSGCGGVAYLAQAAHGQFQVMRARRPLTEVIADPASDARLRARLALVQDARDFASRELGLPDNRSYRTYSDLKRPYVVWNVVAAPQFSVQPLRWCFPVTGCVAYRGYFREASAERFARRLKKRGDDVLVSGVTAYSTLGHFADPVLNTMMGYGDLDLAGTIFHELAHQLIYVRGDSEFDESFAMTVEQTGLARWLAARGRSAELRGYLQRQAQLQLIAELFAAGRERAAALYRSLRGSGFGLDQRRERKRQLLDEVGQQVRTYEAEHGLRTVYDDWIESGLNNAHLAAVGTYYDCVPAFERLLDKHQGDLGRFYAAVRALAQGSPRERRTFCAAANAVGAVDASP
jgi:predicted aminopeptidase